jgi:predicted  nucleic acid-binding Zn-ribbon protein
MGESVETNNNSKNGDRKMNPDLKKLISLQKIDLAIHRKEELLIRLPKDIQASAKARDNAKAELDGFDEQQSSDSKKHRDLELEVEEIKEKIIADKNKLHDVKTNVEYRAMLKEIENYEKRISILEDEQISLMEATEKKSGNRSGYLEKLSEEEKAFEEIKSEKESAIKELESEIAEMKKERTETVRGVTPSVLSAYDRILKARDGIGVAQTRDSNCLACHQIIPQQLYYNVRESEQLIACPHCSRFLYYISPEE